MNVFLVLRKEKYDEFPKEDKKLVEENKCLNVYNIKIKNPDNSANLIDGKLIVYCLKK